MDLSRFPRRRYSAGPTPLEFLPNFTKALSPNGDGPRIWIKRDDMLGLYPGGNKTRKLEFLVADALAKGADTLITCGAPQSNHCRITLAAAVKESLKCRFVIEERVPGSFKESASGNHFLFRLLGVEALTVVPAGSHMAQAMQQVADELAAQGRKGYIIPGGGSNALGGLGYVACAQELQQQFFEQGVSFDRVVVGSGSSGTHGGLVAGFAGNHLNIPIIGIDGSVINPAAWWTLHNQLSPAPTPNTHAFAHRDASGTMTNLTHTTFVSFTKTMIQTSGLGDPAQFSGHSYRRGGATFAAACGAPDAWIKAAGDWTSSAYLRYIEISTGLRQSLATKVASEAASRRQ